MQHAFITTIPDLSLVAGERFHLILAHLTDRKEYVDFYKREREAGAWITQDNSLFELKRSESFDILMRGVTLGIVDELVVPEVLRDHQASIELKNSFLMLHGATLVATKTKLAAVVQANTFDGLVNHFCHLLDDSRIDVVMVPFNLEFDARNNNIKGSGSYYSGTNRVALVMEMLTLAHKTGRQLKPIHLLGLHNPVELALYNNAAGVDFSRVEGIDAIDFAEYAAFMASGLSRHIRSNDSSSCYWHSLYGVQMSAQYGLPYRKIESHVDFDVKMRHADQYSLFKQNQEVIRRLAYGQ